MIYYVSSKYTRRGHVFEIKFENLKGVITSIEVLITTELTGRREGYNFEVIHACYIILCDVMQKCAQTRSVGMILRCNFTSSERCIDECID